jgi:predicted DsbA family dithiol-disulfide isomerase
LEAAAMKVEIWSDVICPWCGLGTHRLERALARFEHGGDVEVIHRSFPLDPTLPSGPGLTPREMLRRKYGMADAQIEASTRRIERMAASEGLAPYIVLDNTVANTELTHELLAYATAQGKNREAWQRMFRAYFGEARSVFDIEALVDLADELGLDRASSRQVLEDRTFRQQVEDEARQAQLLGARGVPFIVIDGRYAVAGAQETDTLLGVLRQVWDETHPPLAPTSLAEDAEGLCGPDGCELPDGRPSRA